MNLILLNVILFFVFAFYGFIQEMSYAVLSKDQVFYDKIKCGDRSTGDICVPFLFLYGWGGLLLFNGFIFLRQYLNKFWMISILTILIIALECLGAMIILKYFGNLGWNYSKTYKYYWCRGAIALEPSIFWLFVVTFAVYLFDFILSPNWPF